MGEQEGRDVVPAERNGRPLGVQVLDEVVHRDCGGGEGVSGVGVMWYSRAGKPPYDE